MKSFFFPLIIAVVFLSSCSEDFIPIENHSEAEIQKRSNFECVENAGCEVNYVFLTKDSWYYNCFTVKFDSTLTLDEIYCVKYAYFSCFQHLRLGLLQPSDPYMEVWCFPTGKPVGGISTTIDADPRVDDGG